MQITFSNSYFETFDIEEDFALKEYWPNMGAIEGSDTDESLILKALNTPIDSPLIEQLVQRGQKALILVDDLTRTTPADKIVPIVIEKLKQGGIKDNDIMLMFALGTHRPMTREEMVQKLGASIVENFSVINHTWEDPETLENIGKTETGIDIWVNKHVISNDIVIGIGHIVPHRVAGYSGGGKIIQPGVCGPITTGQTHWLSAYYTAEQILGRPENPVRQEIEEVAARAGLTFIVNVIQDRTGRLEAVVAGHPIGAHRVGCKIAEKIYGTFVGQKADIVISEAYPTETELWLATKALQSADVIANENGAIILLAECPEGVSQSHGSVISQYGFRPLKEVEKLVEAQQVKDLNVASYLARVGNVVKSKHVILVSRGITPQQAADLGFDFASSAAQAFQKAIRFCGDKPSVAVLHHGSEVLPILKD